MIAVVDYGVGNLFSLRSSLRFIGAESCVSADPAVLRAADKLILPGVGAFGDAADKLRQSGLDRVVTAEAERGKPLLGICLGMQLLFEKSEEYGEHAGLGLLRGRVVGMEGRLPAGLKIPHIGWNALDLARPHPLPAAALRQGGRVRLLRPLLLRRELHGQPDRHGGIRPCAHRRRAEGERHGLPVPSRKKRRRRSEYPAGLL